LSDPGFFISVEGLDGSGKTTQVGLLAEAMSRLGRRVTVVRDPGSTALGERIRELLLEPSAGSPMAPWAETALFLASRLQLAAEVIQPALAGGEVVVSDRYLDSTLAYQGARGLAADDIVTLHRVCGLERLPDLTLILDLPVELAVTRRRNGTPDRMELEATSYHERVRSGYLGLARNFPDRLVILDATRPADELAKLCRELAVERLTVGREI
jgi:dTMP kinase